jgi:hypothetical protein
MMAPRVLHDDGGSQPPTKARRRQQGSDSPDSCASTRLKRSSDGHDATWIGLQHLSDSHVGMYMGLWLLSARHVSTLLPPPRCTPGPSPYVYKRKVQGPRTKRWPRGRTGWRAVSRPLSFSLANACNPLLGAGQHEAAGSPYCFPPCVSVSRRPIWAGTRSDNLLVGPGTPRGQNADKCSFWNLYSIWTDSVTEFVNSITPKQSDLWLSNFNTRKIIKLSTTFSIAHMYRKHNLVHQTYSTPKTVCVA